MTELLFAVFFAFGAETRIDPPPPQYFQNEEAKITTAQGVEVRGEHVNLRRLNDTQWIASFPDLGSGWMEIGTRRVNFTVDPPLDLAFDDPAVMAQRLVAAKRRVAFIVAEPTTLHPYAGQSVGITWYSIVDDQSFQVSISDPNAESMRTDLGDYEKGFTPAPIGGLMLWKRPVLHTTLIAEAPGPIIIPAMNARGHTTAFDNYGAFRRPEADFKRMSNGLLLDVRERPAEAAALPIGPFTLRCEPHQFATYWPAYQIYLQGGDVESIRDVEFEPPSSAPILLTRQRGEIKTAAYWIVTVHSHTLQDFPRLAVKYWDPFTDSVASATCTEPLRIGKYSPVHIVKEAELRKYTEPPAEDARAAKTASAIRLYRGIAFVLALIGIAGVIGATRV